MAAKSKGSKRKVKKKSGGGKNPTSNVAFIAVWGNSAVQVTPATTYKHFRNVPHMKTPFTPNLDMGNQYTTFG